jgi:hypothetical protein
VRSVGSTDTRLGVLVSTRRGSGAPETRGRPSVRIVVANGGQAAYDITAGRSEIAQGGAARLTD